MMSEVVSSIIVIFIIIVHTSSRTSSPSFSASSRAFAINIIIVVEVIRVHVPWSDVVVSLVPRFYARTDTLIYYTTANVVAQR